MQKRPSGDIVPPNKKPKRIICGFYETSKLINIEHKYSYSNENAIVKAFRHGEREAVRWILEYTYQPLAYFAQGVILSACDSEEIIANTFSKLYQIRQDFNSLDTIKKWIYLTVRNECVIYLKKNTIGNDPALVISDETIEQRIETERAKTMLLSNILLEIDKIPRPGPTVFRLYFFEGKATETISQELRLTCKKVSAFLAASLNRLEKKGIKFKPRAR